jgi:hypothetical protein
MRWKLCGEHVKACGRFYGARRRSPFEGRIFRDIHKRPRGESFAISRSERHLAGFPQFHNDHHNNKLYRFQISEKSLLS